MFQTNGWKVTFSWTTGWITGATAIATANDGVPNPGWITGAVSGSQVSFRIAWQNGSIGTDTGNVDARGGVTGTTFDETNTVSRADWSMVPVLKCAW